MYRLVKLTGWTPEQMADVAGVTLDWLLAMEDADAQVAAELDKKRSKNAERRASKAKGKR